MAQERCEREDPALTATPGGPSGTMAHMAACHFAISAAPASPPAAGPARAADPVPPAGSPGSLEGHSA
jgi:hypothetical protein